MRRSLLVAALVPLAACATVPSGGISEGALRQHIAILASDAFEGRKPGTAGGRATEAYVAGQFAAVGLSPGAADGSWLQRVRLVPKNGDPVLANNIIGRVRGTLGGGETIVVMAHWDHLGLCRPPGARDRICNGAVDNASGVAVLIETARGVAHGPRPLRDVLFVATTGEEMGLLGARAFVANPPVPRDRILAALNLDTVAVGPRGSAVSIVGRGMTGLDPVVDAVARSLGRRVDAGRGANALVRRQDGWAMMEAGVPAILVGGAYAGGLFERFLKGRYHQPDDDVASGLVLGGAAEDADLHVALVRALADPRRFPTAATPHAPANHALDSATNPH
ncbi:MAG: family peptidase [Sphingomonas bacterium]|nr:family peptidase [Sphingomonas bacterium]